MSNQSTNNKIKEFSKILVIKLIETKFFIDKI